MTKGLFYDLMLDVYGANKPFYRPVFTLNDETPGYICARTTFIAENDPTGYRWAMKYLADFNHWKYLLRCSWFREALEDWKDELMLVLKANALNRIIEIAGSDTPQSLPAARFLAEEGWLKKRGRPSKLELQGELKKQVELSKLEDDDLERIGGLKMIQGGKK